MKHPGWQENIHQLAGTVARRYFYDVKAGTKKYTNTEAKNFKHVLI